ncbi:F0F1 ATP synthase subunit B [Candidatus Uhrbacteria bacterium]|nr:F0F1 ATP synthase subunit B [Candidatus Uhrbacteria bacterium]
MSSEVQQVAQAAQEVVSSTEASGGLGTLGINLKIFLAQFLNFAVVLFVLWKWVYKPIVKLLEERQEKIERSVKQADDVEKRVRELETEHKEVIATAKSEATKILEEARSASEDRKKELLAKAKEEVKGVVAQGKVQLEAQKEQMIRDAREEIAAIAVEAARKILEDGVDEKKATKLAEAVVDDMSGSRRL